jgi:arginine/ornithine transport system substrate-binding protein
MALRPPFLAALLAALVVAVPAAARDWPRVKIGVDGAYPPFSRTEADGRPAGYDVDVARAVCQKIAAECEIVAVGWDGLVPALDGRRVDALVASMPVVDTARRSYDFTRRYHRIGPRFVARVGEMRDNPVTSKLAGVRVGVRAGTAHAAQLAAAHPQAVVVPFPNEAAAGAAVADRTVDLAFGDTLALYRWLDGPAPRGKVQFVGDEVLDADRFGDGAGIAYRKTDRDLGQLLDRALGDLARDGTLDRIAGRWFPFAIQ